MSTFEVAPAPTTAGYGPLGDRGCKWRISMVLLAVAVVALIAAAAPAFALDHRCGVVSFRSPFTHHAARARVAVRRGSVACHGARALVRQALSRENAATHTGLSWHWKVGKWRRSSAGDGTVTDCVRSSDRVRATTPTPGGYWSQP